MEDPALDWDVGKMLFLQLDRWTRPRGKEREREASWTSLIVTAVVLQAHCARNTKSRCSLAKVKGRTLGCAQAGLTGPRGSGFRGV